VERGGGDPSTVKDWKVKGESAIPKGTYTVRFTYSPRFKKNMWQIIDVPGFDGIRIHAGNTADDTEGCILVGTRIDPNYKGIVNSAVALSNLLEFLSRHDNKDWTLTIS
jgi:hypothetical protein